MMKFKLVTSKMNIKGMTFDYTRAQPITEGVMNFRRFCDEVADGSTVDTADVKAVIDRMAKVLHRRCEEGYSIEVGELGNFRASFRSKAIRDNIEPFDVAKHIIKPKIVFYPRKEFKDLSRMQFHQIKTTGNNAGTKPSSSDSGATGGA